MKKVIYTLAALFACTLPANAQKVLEDDYFETVPSFFTYDHKPYVLVSDYNDEGSYHNVDIPFDIYDATLNKIGSVNLPTNEYGDICHLDLETYIDKNGIRVEFDGDDIYLTQTFFNDDPDWEYITDGTDDEYIIKKADGTIVGALSEEPEGKWWTQDVYIIDDVVYTTLIDEKEENGRYLCTFYFYTLPEFRKFISNNPSSVKAVPTMARTVSKEAYDLMGRKVYDSHKGIVIKDGKKMIKK